MRSAAMATGMAYMSDISKDEIEKPRNFGKYFQTHSTILLLIHHVIRIDRVAFYGGNGGLLYRWRLPQ